MEGFFLSLNKNNGAYSKLRYFYLNILNRLLPIFAGNDIRVDRLTAFDNGDLGIGINGFGDDLCSLFSLLGGYVLAVVDGDYAALFNVLCDKSEAILTGVGDVLDLVLI